MVRPNRTLNRQSPHPPDKPDPIPGSGDSQLPGHTLLAAQRALLDSLPDVMWIKDCESRLTMVNRAFADRYGIAQAAATGLTDFDIYPPEKARQLRDEDLQVMASRKPIRYESVIRVRNTDHCGNRQGAGLRRQRRTDRHRGQFAGYLFAQVSRAGLSAFKRAPGTRAQGLGARTLGPRPADRRTSSLGGLVKADRQHRTGAHLHATGADGTRPPR